MTDFDSPWKEMLEVYFEPFMALFFSEAYIQIDWERGYEFLEKELRQITRDAEVGRRTVDKLVKVWILDGLEAWILVHIEVQAQKDLDFEERMYVYHYRIFDRYHRQVVSLAVLADDSKEWRPTEFSYCLWGCEMRFCYPVIKLLDYQGNPKLLADAGRNPFAVVIRAHLAVLESGKDPDELFKRKFALVKDLYTAGYSRADIVKLFRFIDWLMDLPEAHEQLFWQELSEYEEGKKMPYVTSVERIGIEKGMQQGGLSLLCRMIAKRFRVGVDSARPMFEGLNTEAIEELGERFLDANSLDELRRWADEKRLAEARL